MKKILPAVVVLVAVGTLTIEKLRAYPLTYCTLSCQDCWITWDASVGKFNWGAEILCTAGRVNECNYSITLRMWDNGTGASWETGTSAWTGCNAFVDVRGATAAPLSLQHGHSYTTSITVRDVSIGGEELCYHFVDFWWP